MKLCRESRQEKEIERAISVRRWMHPHNVHPKQLCTWKTEHICMSTLVPANREGRVLSATAVH